MIVGLGDFIFHIFCICAHIVVRHTLAWRLIVDVSLRYRCRVLLQVGELSGYVSRKFPGTEPHLQYCASVFSGLVEQGWDGPD